MTSQQIPAYYTLYTKVNIIRDILRFYDGEVAAERVNAVLVNHDYCPPVYVCEDVKPLLTSRFWPLDEFVASCVPEPA